MKRFLPIALAVCVFTFCAALRAQPFPSAPVATNAPAPPQSIKLDVLVRDKDGEPVHGLAAEDFALFDKGQPQKLAGFTPVAADEHPGAVQVLIVVDMINMGFNSLAWTREQIGEFLKQDAGKLGHPTSIALMTEDGLRMMSGSTTDGSVLETGFEKLATNLRAIQRNGGWAAQNTIMEMSLNQFTQILAVESARPGRKLVLVISPGWPMMPRLGSQEDLRAAQWVFNVDVSLTDAILDARTSVYQLNPFGVGSRTLYYYQSFLKPVSKVNQAEYPFLALGVFAVHSGGRVVIKGHDVAGEISDAVRDAGSYYELSYDAPPADGPNEYHDISVRVNQPGAKAQTLKGYYAAPENVGAKPKN